MGEVFNIYFMTLNQKVNELKAKEEQVKNLHWKATLASETLKKEGALVDAGGGWYTDNKQACVVAWAKYYKCLRQLQKMQGYKDDSITGTQYFSA